MLGRETKAENAPTHNTDRRGNMSNNFAKNILTKIEIRERCKGVHFVDLGESFPTHICLQNLASIQPRIAAVSLAEFVAVHIVLVKLPVAILTQLQFRVKYYYSQSSFRTPPVPSVFQDSPVYQPASQPRTSPSKLDS